MQSQPSKCAPGVLSIAVMLFKGITCLNVSLPSLNVSNEIEATNCKINLINNAFFSCLMKLHIYHQLNGVRKTFRYISIILRSVFVEKIEHGPLIMK